MKSMHRSLRLVVVASLLAVLIATGSQSATAQADPRYFSQTGYRIDNDAFWNFFQGRGGVPTFGYPVSRQFKLVGFQVQIFQRLVMQLQADGCGPDAEPARSRA